MELSIKFFQSKPLRIAAERQYSYPDGGYPYDETVIAVAFENISAAKHFGCNAIGVFHPSYSPFFFKIGEIAGCPALKRVCGKMFREAISAAEAELS
jgi:hypothetical protein